MCSRPVPFWLLGVLLLTGLLAGCSVPQRILRPYRPRPTGPYPPPPPTTTTTTPPARSQDELGFIVMLPDATTLADSCPGTTEFCVTRGQDKPKAGDWKACSARHVVSKLAPGDVTLRVRKAGFAPAKRDLRLPISGGRDVIIVLGPARRTVHGIVYLPDGTTIAKKAKVAVTPVGIDPSQKDWQPTDDGKFEAPSPRDGYHSIHARLSGYPDGLVIAPIPPISDDPLRLVLGQRDRALHWTIADASRNPRRENDFMLHQRTRRGRSRSERTVQERTDASGTLLVVFQGGCDEMVVTPDSQYPRVTITPENLDKYEHYTLLPRGARVVKGKVVDFEGKPVGNGCQVELRVPGEPRPRTTSPGSQDGCYTFYNVPAGSLQLVAKSSEAPDSQVETVEFTGASDLLVPVLKLGKPARLVVTLVGPSGPVKLHADVHAQGSPEPVGDRGSYGQSIRFQGPNEKGEFVAKSARPGEWQIHVSADVCRQVAPVTVMTKAGETTRVSIRVFPLVDASLRILTRAKKPLVSTPVVVSWWLPSERGFRDGGSSQATTDAKGIAHIIGVDPNAEEVAVLCEAGAYKGKPEGFPSTEPTTVVLDAPASVEGTIELVGARYPRAGRGVCVVLSTSPSPPRFEPLVEGWNELGKTRPKDAADRRLAFEPDSPSFRFTKIPVGPLQWYLHLFAPDMVSAPVALNLQPGKTTHVALRAWWPASVRVIVKGTPRDGKGSLSVGLNQESAVPGTSWIRARREAMDASVFVADRIPPAEWVVSASYYDPKDDSAALEGHVLVTAVAGKESVATVSLKPKKVRKLGGSG
ncbi:MAG: carboxypeptidase regulatory-like domain-containing protein [Armatimonadetes bacterium]|nr:carboxypeptidase regulatory-like domain-containing protein [Armatimonadota bacterium]